MWSGPTARLLSEGLRPVEGPCGPSNPTPSPSKLVTSTAASRVPGAVCSIAAPAAFLGGNAGAPTRACGAASSIAALNSSVGIRVDVGMVQLRTGEDGGHGDGGRCRRGCRPAYAEGAVC